MSWAGSRIRRRPGSTNSSPGTGCRNRSSIRPRRPAPAPVLHRRRHPATKLSLKHPAAFGGCVWTPRLTQAFSSVGSAHAVRCCRVSGLSMRHVTRRGPSWRCADRVHIAYASSNALHPQTGFPDPVSIDRLPLPFLRPARVPDSYPPGRLSGGGGSPVTLLLRHQRPDDARHPVGQRHRDQHARLARQHPGKPRIVRPAAPDRPADHRHGARDQ